MLKRIRITVLEPTLLPSNLVHYATNFKISKSINFYNTDLIINETDNVNLYDNNFTIDIKEDDNLYVVTQYVYKEIDSNGLPLKDGNGDDVIKYGTPSRISSVKGNQEGVKISDTIVNTPTIIIGTSYNYNLDGNVMVKTSDFRMFSSTGEHKASTWIIKNLSGDVIFKREYDLDNLTSIILPDEIKLEDNFIVYVMHHSTTNADSNYGVKENIISNELPIYKVFPANKFIVGKVLYFNVELFNKRFKNIKMSITDSVGNVTVTDNITKTLIKVSTTGFKEKVNYKFNFAITSENDITVDVDVVLFSHSYKELFDTNKTYLDKYNYLGLIMTNGETNNFSYELSNGSIILQKNITNYLVNSNADSNGITYLDKVADISKDEIYTPNLYVNEMLNGDVVVSYKDTNEDIKICVYNVDPVSNALTLANPNTYLTLSNQEPLSISGGITVSGNHVYYINYDLNKLVKLEPYTAVSESYDLPYTALHGISITSNLDGNIILAGGTDTNVYNYNILHTRKNNKAYLFNITTKTYSEIGNNILSTLPAEIYQFHMVFRHDNKITIFNNVNDTNYDIIGDQTTYILDFVNNTLVNKLNDHLDKIPYGTTIVLRNGDILRVSSIAKDPQKIYSYIADSSDGANIVDNNTIAYDPTKVIIMNGEVVHIDKPCMYDSIKINPGGFVTLGEDTETRYDSTVLIVTRDLVMTQTEFRAAKYSMVYKACTDARFVLLG